MNNLKTNEKIVKDMLCPAPIVEKIQCAPYRQKMLWLWFIVHCDWDNFTEVDFSNINKNLKLEKNLFNDKMLNETIEQLEKKGFIDLNVYEDKVTYKLSYKILSIDKRRQWLKQTKEVENDKLQD